MASAQAPDPRVNPLVGTWRLVLYEDRDATGHPHYPYGNPPSGFFVYTASGQFFIQVAASPPAANLLPSFEDSSAGSLDRAELVRSLDSYSAYFGTYTVDTTKGVVIHHVQADLWRIYTGTDQVRPFHLFGDSLVIGDGRTWQRILLRVR